MSVLSLILISAQWGVGVSPSSSSACYSRVFGHSTLARSRSRPHVHTPFHLHTSALHPARVTRSHFSTRSHSCPHVSFARHPRSVVRSRTRPRVVPCPLFTPALSALFLASRLRSMRARSSSRVHYSSGSVHRGDAVSLALLDFPFLSSPLVVPIPMLVTSIRYARDQGW